jgi:transcriptional repressor NrdR
MAIPGHRGVGCPVRPVGSRGVRCPQCASLDDKVVDSRTSEEGAAIRRRRECLACGRRFTTYERLEEAPFMVVKRSGLRQPFDRAKVVDGLRAAAKNRPVAIRSMEILAGEVEESLRIEGSEVSSQDIGVAVLQRLREVDDVTYLRFASVYKDFRDVEDFRREVGDLIKETAPKQSR